MNGKVTYHQQVGYCGKSRCRKCREGTGHGPYWYSYQTVDGRTIRTYIGKHLPPNVQATVEGMQPIKKITVDREPEARVRVYTLGQFRMERHVGSDSRDWETVNDALWQHQRVRSLLACLMSNPHRTLGREQVVDMLWSDNTPEIAMGRLDRAVHSLRQIFEPDRRKAATSPLLLTERELITLATQHDIWLDADAFDQLLIQARNSKDAGERERLIEEAVTLYGGEFLPEERSLASTRMRRDALQRAWIGALLELADLRIERQALNDAIEPLDRLLAFEPTNEAGVQRLMKLLTQLGRRAEALRVYNRFQKTLHDEFGIAPLPNTRTLYESVRGSGNKRPTLTSAPPVASPTASTPQSSAQSIQSPQTAQPTPITKSVQVQVPTKRVESAKETQEHKEETREIRPQRDPDSREVIGPAVQIGRVHQSELVGREQELAVLREMLQETERAARFKLPTQKRLASSLALDTQRKPQSALLLGEVGIGKTRLAEEVGREVRKRGWVVAWGRVYSQEGVIPYRLWIEILGKAMEYGVWQRQDVSKRPLIFQPLTLLLPEMHDLVPQVALPAMLPPEQEQLRIWESTLELLTTISAGAPLLIVLDDLQWADSSSQELFAYLARRISGLPIVLIATCRENELAPKHPLRSMFTDLQRERALTSLPLDTLSDEQIGTLVSRFPSDPRFPVPLIERIQERADGNPLFAEELARSAVDALGNKEHDLLPANFPANLPDTISAVLELRIARISKECQRLLTRAAVLGGTFEFWLINAMEASVSNNTASEDDILELIEEALRSGMLTEEGIGAQITYQFWHPLLVNYLYESLSAARRASLHRRAANILRDAYKDSPDEEAAHAATITHHLIHGGAESALIIRYAELAADHAYTLSAYPDAEKHYQIALDYLPPGLDDHRAYLLESLGECARIQGKYEEARRHYEQSLHVRHNLNTPLEDEQQEAQLRAMLLCEIGWTWYDVGDNAQAVKKYIESEQVLHAANIERGPAWAKILLQRSYVSWRQGNYAEAKRLAQQSLELFTESTKRESFNTSSFVTLIRRTLAGDPSNIGRSHVILGDIEIATGHYADALSHFDTALPIFEQYERQREIAIVCCNVGDVYLRRSEYDDAQVILRRSQNIAERIGETPLVSFALGNLGIVAMRLSNFTEGQVDLARAVTGSESINDLASVSPWSTFLGIALSEQGKTIEARTALYKAIDTGHKTHIPPYIGLALIAISNLRITQTLATDITSERRQLLRRSQKSLQRALAIEGIEADTRVEGQLLMAHTLFLLDDIAASKKLATDVLDEATNLNMTWLVARTHRLLGDILTQQGRFGSARKQYEQSRRIFNERDMKLELARTVHHYGLVFLRMNGDEQQRQRGMTYLRAARQTFIRCGAMLDVQLVERDIDTYKSIMPKSGGNRV